jgi:hypothetical protein
MLIFVHSIGLWHIRGFEIPPRRIHLPLVAMLLIDDHLTMDMIKYLKLLIFISFLSCSNEKSKTKSDADKHLADQKELILISSGQFEPNTKIEIDGFEFKFVSIQILIPYTSLRLTQTSLPQADFELELCLHRYINSPKVSW